MGIKVLDHLVIGRNRYYSFADQGHIRTWEVEFGKGPEIILKALIDETVMAACRPLVIGDRRVLRAALVRSLWSIRWTGDECQGKNGAARR